MEGIRWRSRLEGRDFRGDGRDAFGVRTSFAPKAGCRTEDIGRCSGSARGVKPLIQKMQADTIPKRKRPIKWLKLLASG